MSFRIKTNAMSAHALRALERQTGDLRESTDKLASGKRINAAKDDAAGLSISENLRAKVRSLAAAKRNSLDALSILEVAEGGFFETSSILIRLRELAVQAGSDTVGQTERGYLDREFVTMKEEIDRIAATVMYNGVRLAVGMPDPPASTIKDLPPQRQLDYPMEFQIDASYLLHSDAASSPNPVDVVRFDSRNLVATTAGERSLQLGAGYEGARLNSKVAAHHSIAAVDDALKTVAKQRAAVGALQARLKDIMGTIDIRLETSSQGASRIVDADYAEETARYTSLSILQKASAAVLASANVQPQQALLEKPQVTVQLQTDI